MNYEQHTNMLFATQFRASSSVTLSEGSSDNLDCLLSSIYPYTIASFVLLNAVR